jgi:hypothetical protein
MRLVTTAWTGWRRDGLLLAAGGATSNVLSRANTGKHPTPEEESDECAHDVAGPGRRGQVREAGGRRPGDLRRDPAPGKGARTDLAPLLGQRHGDLRRRRWPNEEAFNGFFQTTPEIQQLMQRAGVTAPPQVGFWRQADTRDEYPPAT